MIPISFRFIFFVYRLFHHFRPRSFFARNDGGERRRIPLCCGCVFFLFLYFSESCLESLYTAAGLRYTKFMYTGGDVASPCKTISEITHRYHYTYTAAYTRVLLTLCIIYTTCFFLFLFYFIFFLLYRETATDIEAAGSSLHYIWIHIVRPIGLWFYISVGGFTMIGNTANRYIAGLPRGFLWALSIQASISLSDCLYLALLRCDRERTSRDV